MMKKLFFALLLAMCAPAIADPYYDVYEYYQKLPPDGLRWYKYKCRIYRGVNDNSVYDFYTVSCWANDADYPYTEWWQWGSSGPVTIQLPDSTAIFYSTLFTPPCPDGFTANLEGIISAEPIGGGSAAQYELAPGSGAPFTTVTSSWCPI